MFFTVFRTTVDSRAPSNLFLVHACCNVTAKACHGARRLGSPRFCASVNDMLRDGLSKAAIGSLRERALQASGLYCTLQATIRKLRSY